MPEQQESRPSAAGGTLSVAADAPIVVMGRVLGPYGVIGWIKLEAYTEAPATLLGFPVWWLRPPGSEAWTARPMTAGRIHADTLVAHLAGIDSREAALAAKGCEVGVPRADLPRASANEIYWADLVGLRVVNREGRVLGRVRAVTEHGAHPLLQVTPIDGDGPERLIPYVPAAIDAIDMAQQRIEVDWGEDY